MLNREYLQDAKESILKFEKIVLPFIKETNFIKGTFVHIEKATVDKYKDLTKEFDMHSSIDLFNVRPKGIIGLSLRIQGGYYNSFTIRKSRLSNNETEYVKIGRAIKNKGKYIYPYYMMQCYINNGKLCSIGFAKTKDILKCIDKKKYILNHDEKSDFYPVFWKDMKDKGFKVKTKIIN